MDYKEITIVNNKNGKGIGQARNFIREYYNHGEYVWGIDDDVEEIYKCEFGDTPNLNRLNIVSDLDEWIRNAFKLCAEKNLNFWGVPSFDNPFFMNKEPSTNLKYIGGVFVGLIIDKEKKPIRVNIDHFEDYEFCCLHFLRDNGILRFNDMALKSNFYNPKGGICATYGGFMNRMEDAKHVAEYLVNNYRGMCSITNNKKRDLINMKLNSRYKNSVVPMIILK
jgi:hypothetical protein